MHDLKGEHKQSRQQFAGGFVVQRRKGNEYNQYSDRRNQAVYVNVIIDRWEKLTGEKAVLLNSTADE